MREEMQDDNELSPFSLREKRKKYNSIVGNANNV
jgi:hypothetical protein